MSAFCRILMICWVPIILLVFLSKRPTRKALLISMIMTWMVLPPAGLEIPGFPDYTKAVAASFGCLLGVVIFDGKRILTFSPKWYDLPMLVFNFSPIITSTQNGLGLYDGFSAALFNLSWWGCPYFLGRIYLTERESLETAFLIFLPATLLYAPPTLWEVRMSPQLMRVVYGIDLGTFIVARYGLGYRPFVFMASGLELSLWIGFAAIFAYAMWAGKRVKDLLGVSMGLIVIFLVLLCLSTKSVGSIFLMLLGIGVIWGTRRLGNPILLWMLLLAPIAYGGTRITGAWSGDNLVELSERYLGPERASSLSTRFVNEDRLIARALEQRYFGWGGHNRSRVADERGRDITLSDGLWVIYLGTQGTVGLGALTLALLIPQASFLLRNRRTQWKSPEMSSMIAASVFCGLFTADSLLNSNVNPFYLMLVGGVMGFTGTRRASPLEQASNSLAMADELSQHDALEEAEATYRMAIHGFAAVRTDDPVELIGQGEASRSLGRLLESQGRYEEAHEQFLDAVRIYEERANLGTTSPALREAWSRALDALARDLKGQGREAEAEVALRRSIGILEGGLPSATAGDQLWRSFADRLNDLAWLLVMPEDPARADAPAAVAMAHRASLMQPDESCFWNTLGVARLQAGDDQGAIEAASRSIELSHGGTAFDHYVMAMACTRLGDPAVGQRWFLQGEQWRASNGEPSFDLERVRAQAEAVISNAFSHEAATIFPSE